MEDLITGYRRFRSGTWAHARSRFEELSRSGQSPRTMLIACSDSRADPQMIFDAAPGALVHGELGNIHIVQGDTAGIRTYQTDDHIERRGFPCAIRT